MPSGYTTSLPTDVILETGLLYVNSVIIGVSRGGLRFNPGITLGNIEYDGKKAPVKGLDRVVNRTPQIVGTFLQAGAANFRQYEPGGATPNITPKPQGALFASGDYLVNLDLVYARGGGGTATVRFASALCVQYEVQGGSDAVGEAEISCTFEARLVHGATPDDTAVPYTITVA